MRLLELGQRLDLALAVNCVPGTPSHYVRLSVRPDLLSLSLPLSLPLSLSPSLSLSLSLSPSLSLSACPQMADPDRVPQLCVCIEIHCCMSLSRLQ